MKSGIWAATAVAIVVVSVGAGSAAGGEARGGAAAQAKKCTKAIVNGRHACLRKGQRCKKAFQEDYVRAGLACKGGRLRKASPKQLRGPEPLLIDDKGQISLRTALAGFDARIADLPGIKAKPGEIGPLADGTIVIDEIESNLDRLTTAQRAVYDSMTTPAPDAEAVIVQPDGSITPRPTAGRGPTQFERMEAEKAAGDAIRVLRAHGFLLARPMKLTFLDDQGGKKEDVLAFVTAADLPPATSPYCNIFLTRLGRNQATPLKATTITHELVHCAQHTYYQSKADRSKAPKWASEGTADFIAGKVMLELGQAPVGLGWNGWFLKSKLDLFKRSYDALGFFAMIDQANVDPWQRSRDVMAASPGGSAAAYAAARAGLPDIFYMRWGPGINREPALGPEWDYTGPAIPSTHPKPTKINNGTHKVATVEAHAGTGGKLEIKADVLTIKADKDLQGFMRSGSDQLKLAKGAYCAKPGGCKCKTQTNLQLPKLDPTTFVGFNAPEKPRTVVFDGLSVKDYCNKPSPGPGPISCDTGGGGTTARPLRRGGGDSCPEPDEFGIQVFQGAEDPVVVATFKIGECTKGQGFTAIATDGAWRLEVGINAFSGFHDYDVPYGGSDPQVIIDGPSASYSNSYWAPGGLPNAGQITFDPEGRRMGLGVFEIRDQSGTQAIGAAGGMTCVYPDD